MPPLAKEARPDVIVEQVEAIFPKFPGFKFIGSFGFSPSELFYGRVAFWDWFQEGPPKNFTRKELSWHTHWARHSEKGLLPRFQLWGTKEGLGSLGGLVFPGKRAPEGKRDDWTSLGLHGVPKER